ncbi:hypothetical protein LMED105_14620 [Limnobacter sp. MED105]|nr:hypothetical protein LMED105_14620 [Limnobacter sp. MED105]
MLVPEVPAETPLDSEEQAATRSIASGQKSCCSLR